LGLIPWPKVDFAKFGPIERKELSRIKKISGANLLRNAIMIPAVTNHDDADITDLGAVPERAYRLGLRRGDDTVYYLVSSKTTRCGFSRPDFLTRQTLIKTTK
jgi:hypothetical protein